MRLDRWRALGCALVLALVAAAAPLLARGQADAGPDAEAWALLERATQRLERAERLRYRVQSAYSVLRESGLHVEFGGESTITVRRPNRLRIDSEQRNGTRRTLYFDGKVATLYNADAKAYARVEIGGTIQAAIYKLEGEVGVPIPLSDLIYPNLTELLRTAVEEISLVEEQLIDGTRCAHLALTGPEVQAQFWVSQGDAPLIRRVVITHVNLPGSPQLHASLVDWDLDPKTPDTLFRFEPPKGAEQVPFVEVGPKRAAPDTDFGW